MTPADGTENPFINGWTLAFARDTIKKIDQIAKNPKPQSTPAVP